MLLKTHSREKFFFWDLVIEFSIETVKETVLDLSVLIVYYWDIADFDFELAILVKHFYGAMGSVDL